MKARKKEPSSSPSRNANLTHCKCITAEACVGCGSATRYETMHWCVLAYVGASTAIRFIFTDIKAYTAVVIDRRS